MPHRLGPLKMKGHVFRYSWGIRVLALFLIVLVFIAIVGILENNFRYFDLLSICVWSIAGAAWVFVGYLILRHYFVSRIELFEGHVIFYNFNGRATDVRIEEVARVELYSGLVRAFILHTSTGRRHVIDPALGDVQRLVQLVSPVAKERSDLASEA